MSAGARSASKVGRIAARGMSAGIALMIGCLGSGTISAAGAREIDMADLFLVEDDGGWMCGGRNGHVTCPEGRGSEQAASELLASFNGAPQPQLYLRVAKARNQCGQSGPCMTAVPDPAKDPEDPEPLAVLGTLRALQAQQIKLGVVIGADQDARERARKTENVARQACAIGKADTEHLYDFIFLDMTLNVSKAALVRMVHAIKQGRTVDGKPCPGGRRWKVIVNDNHTATLETGAWGHAQGLGLLGPKVKDPEVLDAAASKASLFRPKDRKFLRRVANLHDGSRAILRLEVPPATSRLAGFDAEVQCALLTGWAKRQKSMQFTFIYPLYVHSVGLLGPYDSFGLGTIGLQRQLMDLYPAKAPAHRAVCALTAGKARPETPTAPPPPPPQPPAARVAGVESKDASAVTCRSARLHGWVNPHGTPTRFHFEYWKRPNEAQLTGAGDAGAGVAREEVSRVADGLEPGTGYSAALIADNAAGRSISNVVSFTTPARCR